MRARFLIVALLFAGPAVAEEPYVYDGRLCYGVEEWLCGVAPLCEWDQDGRSPHSAFIYGEKPTPHCRAVRPISVELAKEAKRRIESGDYPCVGASRPCADPGK